MKRARQVPGSPPPASTSDLVRAATVEVDGHGGRRARSGAFSFLSGLPAERVVAPFLGLYLAYVVARLPEVFPSLFVPRLPMVLLAVFMLLLAVAIPPDGWRQIWAASLPLKCVAALFVLAIVTAPLGIWMSGSLDFVRRAYIIPVVLFVACTVFLRDRRNMRTAVTVYVICVVAISLYVVLTYDPNAPMLDEAGNILDLDEIGEGMRRMQVSPSLDPNDWGAVLATTVPLGLWLAHGGFWRRIFWGSASLIMVWAMVPTQSRGGLVGLVAVAMVLITVGATGWRRFVLLATVVGGGLLFTMVASAGQMSRFLSFSGDDYNLTNEGRSFFWKQGMIWMVKRPWGYGINNFPTYFGEMNGPDRAAHSTWVQYGMELGVLGLALFITLCVVLWRRNKRNRRVALALKPQVGKPAEAESALAGHVMAMMAGTLVTGSFLSNAYYPLTYMCLGLAAAALLGYPFRGQLEAPPPVSASEPTRAPAHPRQMPRSTRSR